MISKAFRGLVRSRPQATVVAWVLGQLVFDLDSSHKSDFLIRAVRASDFRERLRARSHASPVLVRLIPREIAQSVS